MIVSGTWWKRAEAPLKAAALLSLLALGGCGLDQLLFSKPPAEPPPEPLPPSRGDASRIDISSGLAPLPTPQQVLAAVPFGRADPFAPYPVAGAAAPAATAAPGAAPVQAAGAAAAAAGSSARSAGATGSTAGGTPVVPDGLVLNGVMRTGGRAAALVTYGTVTGTLRPGDRGGRTTDLLPQGWTLASIQFGGRTPRDPPSITLQSGKQKFKVPLL